MSSLKFNVSVSSVHSPAAVGNVSIRGYGPKKKPGKEKPTSKVLKSPWRIY